MALHIAGVKLEHKKRKRVGGSNNASELFCSLAVVVVAEASKEKVNTGVSMAMDG